VDHKRLVKVGFACLILCLMGSCLVEIAGATQDSDTWYTKGLDLYFDHKYDEAIKAFDKAIEIDPQSSTLWDAKGLALDKLNKHDEAIKSYDKAIEINSHDSKTWNNKGEALSRLNKDNEAIQAFDKAIEIDPKNSLAWKNKVEVLVYLNKFDEVKQTYKKATEINPQHSMVWSDEDHLNTNSPDLFGPYPSSITTSSININQKSGTMTNSTSITNERKHQNRLFWEFESR
jgi:tetratricopeptide (TPR) repeat protein